LNKKFKCFDIQIADREHRILTANEAMSVINDVERSFDHNLLYYVIKHQAEPTFLEFCLENIEMFKEKLHQSGYKLIIFKESPTTE
jgi:hypothetical protein